MTEKDIAKLGLAIAQNLIKLSNENTGEIRSATNARKNIIKNAEAEKMETNLGNPQILPLQSQIPPTLDEMIQKHIFNYMQQSSGVSEYDFDDADDWEYDDDDDDFDGSKHYYETRIPKDDAVEPPKDSTAGEPGEVKIDKQQNNDVDS